MKITVQINGKDTEIELTADQVQIVKKATEKITDRIKTFNDVLTELGLTKNYFDNTCTTLNKFEKANRQIEMITKVFNEGWKAEPFNENQYKYYPYFRVENKAFVCRDCFSWYSNAFVSSRLCYKSSELAIYAGKTFIDIYNKLLS